jgi:shikimate kinase
MAGTTIEDLVSARGWKIFRVLEKEAVAGVAAKDRQVIATGGGAVEDPDNARNLAERGFVVWLDGRSTVLKGRLKEEQRSGKIRPSLTGEASQEEMRRIMETRRGQYERVSSLRVDTSDRTAAEVVEKIVDALEQKGGRPHGR